MPPETPTSPLYQPVQPQLPPAPASPSSNGLAIAALILTFLIAPVGLVLSIIVLAQRRGGRGLAVTGLIVSIINIVISVLAVVVLVSAAHHVQQQTKVEPSLEQRADDATIRANAYAVIKRVEEYFASTGSYPSTTQMADSTWIAANFEGLDPATAKTFLSDKTTYGYTATPESCANTDTSQCTNYEVTYKTSKGDMKYSSAMTEPSNQ